MEVHRMHALIRAIALSGLALVGSVVLAGSGLVGHGTGSVVDANAVMSRQAFHDQMRNLWGADHIVWTRCFIISAATLPDNLPDIGPTTDRLLANQTAIGDAIKPFYGNAAGDALTALLRTHILIAAQLVADAKAGLTTAVAADSAAWYANADEIATFLHNANPRNWSFATLQNLLDQHLDLTLAEATARLQGHYSADISAYDRIHAEILQLADTLSAGIIAQFPQKFAG
jgi:hypothetical protein